MEVSAVAVYRPAGQTSTEASGRIHYVFHVKVNLDPEVDSRRGNLDIISTNSIWQFIRLPQRLLEEFLVFFYVNVDSNPEVDLCWLVPARFAQGNLDIIPMSFMWTSEGGFCRILRHFSHSVRMDVSAHFSALDDEEFFVVEGSGWRGRRESDSQVFCHSNSVHASAFHG